jgi:hypothetical protein
VTYIAPIYAALIAAGAAALERATLERRWLRSGPIAAIAVAGLAIMPLATPALPLRALLGYQPASFRNSLPINSAGTSSKRRSRARSPLSRPVSAKRPRS